MILTISQSSRATDSSATDEELASLAQKGRNGAFDELVRRHWAGVNRFLLGYLARGSSEDVAQETFLRAYRKIDRYDCNRPFLPWLFTLSRRLALNEIRKKKRLREFSLQERQVEEDRGAEPLSFGPLWKLAREKLSPDAFSAMRLHYAEDLPIEEVARVLRKGKIATKVMLHRARRKLAQFSDQLKKDYEDPA